MGKQSASINLIKSDNRQLGNQIVNWFLTIGRVMIIIVEIIALSAFIYRFVLDNQLRDINSKIQQEEAFLLTQSKKEAEYRNLQDRLDLASTTLDQGKNRIKTYKKIVEFTPVGISFTNLTYANKQITMQFNTNSVFPLSIFINKLKTYKETESISVDSVENKTASAVIVVGLTVNFKDEGSQSASN